MLKVGIVGCSWAGRAHAAAFQQIKDAQLVAVADVDLDIASAFAQKFKVPRVYADYKDLLEREQIDLISICTPTSTHMEIALYAAECGVSGMLIEKPMARTSEQCQEIITTGQKKNISISVCHNRLFFPSVQAASTKLETHKQGLKLVRATFFLWSPPRDHWKTKQEEGGMLWEEGCHAAYLLQHFLSEIVEVQAFGSRLRHSVYDDITAFVRCADDSWGIMEVSWVREPSLSLEIFPFEHPPLKVNLDYREVTKINAYSSGEFIRQAIPLLPRHLASILLSKLRLRSQAMPVSHHLELIDSHVKAMTRGERPLVSPEEGKAAIQLLECVEKSILEKRPVRYEELF